MEIHLIRHGKTEANEKKLYCGVTDLPLSENGVNEITANKSLNIYPLSVGLYFTSGLLRTEQTLKIICGADVEKTVIPGLAEFNFGQFEMCGHEELKGQDAYQAWISDTTGEIECPGGESKKLFEARILRGYAALIKAIGQASSDSALVVCHGGTITCIMEHLVPDQNNFYEWQPQPGRGYTLSYLSGEFQEYAKI